MNFRFLSPPILSLLALSLSMFPAQEAQEASKLSVQHERDMLLVAEEQARRLIFALRMAEREALAEELEKETGVMTERARETIEKQDAREILEVYELGLRKIIEKIEGRFRKEVLQVMNDEYREFPASEKIWSLIADAKKGDENYLRDSEERMRLQAQESVAQFELERGKFRLSLKEFDEELEKAPREFISPETWARICLIKRKLAALEDMSLDDFVKLMKGIAERNEGRLAQKDLESVEKFSPVLPSFYRQKIKDNGLMTAFFTSELGRREDVEVFREACRVQIRGTCAFEALANIIFGSVEHRCLSEMDRVHFRRLMRSLVGIETPRSQALGFGNVVCVVEKCDLPRTHILLAVMPDSDSDYSNYFSYIVKKEDFDKSEFHAGSEEEKAERFKQIQRERKEKIQNDFENMQHGEAMNFFLLDIGHISGGYSGHAAVLTVTKPLSNDEKWKICFLDSRSLRDSDEIFAIALSSFLSLIDEVLPYRA